MSEPKKSAQIIQGLKNLYSIVSDGSPIIVECRIKEMDKAGVWRDTKRYFVNDDGLEALSCGEVKLDED